MLYWTRDPSTSTNAHLQSHCDHISVHDHEQSQLDVRPCTNTCKYALQYFQPMVAGRIVAHILNEFAITCSLALTI